MQNILDRYSKVLDIDIIRQEITAVQETVKQYTTADRLKKLLTMIDLTSLNTDDNEQRISEICGRLNGFSQAFPGIPGVAAICLYPSLVHIAAKSLEVPGIKIASVAGAFPSSQTFLEVKSLEARMAVDAGAGEIDMVIPLGKFLEGDYAMVAGEIHTIKRCIGNAHLKVILETGLLRLHEISERQVFWQCNRGLILLRPRPES
jgi:deoxyribose-phosphate aldolase